MKTGKSLQQLAAEIERQAETRKDYVAPLASLTMHPLANDCALGVKGVDTFDINDLAHRQIGDHVGVPAKYYDRMRREAPVLLADNVNHWMGKDNSARMVRTLDGNIRAFLSDKYRPLENADLAEAVLPALLEMKLEVMSCEITERRLYIKAVDARINRDVPSGKNRMGDGSHVIFDTLSPAIIISNSEVGMGALSVETAVWTRACTNMAIFGQRSLRKYHVGGKHELTDGLVSLLSEKTRRLSDAATWAQVSDVVKGAFDRARFDASVDDMMGMDKQPILGDVPKVIELAARHFDMQEGERKSVLRHLIEGGDLTRYGLFNAITRTAEDLADYDRATDFERMGGKVIELAANEWQRIAEAA